MFFSAFLWKFFFEKWRSGFDLDEFHALCLKIVSFGRQQQQKKIKYTLSESYSIVSQQHEIEKKKKKEWKVTMKGIEHLKVVT